MDRQTCGTVEVYEFLLAGGGSNVVELAVHMLLLNTAFAVLTAEPVTAHFFNLIGITSKGYLYTYMISTTVGYTIAFILNRKITFKADAIRRSAWHSMRSWYCS